jgi:integrase
MKNRKRRGRGEGSIYQEADGRWVATISLGYRENGRRRRRKVTGKTKSQVQERLRKLLNESAAGINVDSNTLTVAEYLDQWRETTASRSVRPGTLARYEQLIRLRIRPHLGGVRLSKLTPCHVERFFTDLENAGVSARGQQMAGNVLGRALKDAVRLRLISSNPVRDVVKPKPAKPKIHVWDNEQVTAFLKVAKKDRLYALYVTAVTTGMRLGELFALQWEDVSWEDSCVRVQRSLEELQGRLTLKEPKSPRARRRIDLPKFTVDALHEHRKRMLAEGHRSKPVFCDSDGGWLRGPNFTRRSFRPLIKEAKLPQIRFHDLRHTHATILLLANVHPKIVSERLGHASIELTLNTYSHALPTMQKDAAEKLDGVFGPIGSPMAPTEQTAASG